MQCTLNPSLSFLRNSISSANLHRKYSRDQTAMGSKNKKKEKKNSNSESNGKFQKVITDARFASVQSDPRFQNPPKHKSKVTIDSRFNRLFTDKKFTSSATRIDKRGRKRKDSSAQNPLKNYYRLDEEEEEKKKRSEDVEIEEEEVEEKRNEDVETEEEESGSDVEIGKLKKPKVESSGLEIESESEQLHSEGDEDDTAGDGDSSSTDSDAEIYSEEEETLVQEENVPEIEKETHRLAVVNMDWNQVKAVDLYVLLSSFVPKGGQIISVSVYPSEFGLKRMEEEAVHGPIGLFDDKNAKNESDDDDADELDVEKLRAYELSRLRYYYAVVECDSVAVADHLYKNCDGVEFERSSNKLDLRFIPDSMEFKHAPRDVATQAPGSYEGIDFQTRALQQSKVHLTWDEDEPQRSKTLKRNFNADQLAELELKEYVASDESDTDGNEEYDDLGDESDKKNKKQHMYRALIQSGDASEGDEDEGGQDMEVTFNTGLEDISKRIMEKKDKISETVWEAHLRRKKEKKKARKTRSKDSSEDESSDGEREPAEEPDDFFVEEPNVKRIKQDRGKSTRKGKQPQDTAKDAEASRAELELLLADENGDTNLKGYNLKPKKSKGKKGKEIPGEEKLPTIDEDDRRRFSALLNTPLFALDPTDPQFKRSAAFARQVAEKHRKGKHEETGNVLARLHEQAQVCDDPEAGADSHARKDKYEISSLVKSIKMKSKQLPVSSNNKISSKKKKGTLISKSNKKARVL